MGLESFSSGTAAARLMLALWLSPTGFGSFSNSGTAASPGNCADSPDSVLKDMIGSTCAELKLMGKCGSSDALVASLMAKHCAASCTDCIPSRMTYTGDTDGIMCKETDDLPGGAVPATFGLGDDLSYASGFAAGEGVSGDYRLNWAKCCATAAMQVDTGAFSSSSNSNYRVSETAIACMEHSSDTGTGGDCLTYELSNGMTGTSHMDSSRVYPQACCSNAVRDGYPDGGYDPMCVFDYCLKKLSPY